MSARGLRGPCFGLLITGASIAVAVWFLARSFGAHHVLIAVTRADIQILALPVGVGVIIQVVRAHRARWLLADGHSVALNHSYGAMVLSHGIGDLIPLAPAGPVLRSVLTERLSGIPIGFSSGVFMIEGMLDGIGPALLMGYLLLALPLPAWTRWVLIAALSQAVLVFVVPIVVCAIRRGSQARKPPTTRFGRMVGDLASGFTVLASRRRRLAGILALSLFVTGLSALQADLFLQAFDLGASLNHLLLLLAVTLTAGSIPIKLPGAGTLTAAAVLPLAGIHGAGLAGYLLFSRLVTSTETPVLAMSLLLWWSVRGQHRELGFGDIMTMVRT